MNANELRAAFAALPPLEGELPAHTWHKHRLMLREHVQRDEIAKFLQWSTVVATMFVGTGAAFTPVQLSRLTPRYLGAIAEPGVGTPERYDGWTSGNLIHQAYHLMQWEQATGKHVEELDSIVEIGGGYGALALICARLGFCGRYVIADLPELELLQRYYLSNCGVEGVGWIPVHELDEGCNLLIALYSITEMEVDDRWGILNNVPAQHLLLCHQTGFTPFKTRVDNVAWSAEMVKAYGGTRYNVDLPGLEGHWYVVR